MVTSFDRPVLDLRDIVKIYDNERLVLDRLNLSVEKSEVLAIIGPTGCGKSTLLRCINGLEDIQGGEILLDGEAITDGSSSWSQVRQRVGMVFQSYDLFPHLSVMDNLVLAPVRVRKQRKEDVEKKALGLLERVGLADRADAYPHQLSGGQKQRWPLFARSLWSLTFFSLMRLRPRSILRWCAKCWTWWQIWPKRG